MHQNEKKGMDDFMKIALINGSPKGNNSASAGLLADLKSHIGGKAEIAETGLCKTAVSEEILTALIHADVWVFAYPLYVDGIPSHLLSCLMQLQKSESDFGKISVYGIVNCGFYEGIQADLALKILENWCTKAGLRWGGGIGIGGGGALSQMPAAKDGHGPKAPIYKALQALAGSILQLKAQENNYVSIAFPRFLYKMAAQTGWRLTIKKNGGKPADLGKRPD